MRFAISTLIVTLLASCDPHVDVVNISPDKLLSVSCFISPQDTVFRAYVYRGSALGSTIKLDSAAVKDALVTISSGNSFDTLYLAYVEHPITGVKSYRYEGRKKNVAVTTNSTCSLKVQAITGEVVTATCTIPPEAGKPSITGEQVNNDYYFSVTWSERQPHKYFILDVNAEGFYEVSTPSGVRWFMVSTFLLEPTTFPSDVQLPYNEYEGVLQNAFIAETPVLRATVKNIEEGLFKYFRSYAQYQDWDANNSGGILPNFRQMPLIHSNINGGVGFFGGYNQSTVEIIF